MKKTNRSIGWVLRKIYAVAVFLLGILWFAGSLWSARAFNDAKEVLFDLQTFWQLGLAWVILFVIHLLLRIRYEDESIEELWNSGGQNESEHVLIKCLNCNHRIEMGLLTCPRCGVGLSNTTEAWFKLQHGKFLLAHRDFLEAEKPLSEAASLGNSEAISTLNLIANQIAEAKRRANLPFLNRIREDFSLILVFLSALFEFFVNLLLVPISFILALFFAAVKFVWIIFLSVVSGASHTKAAKDLRLAIKGKYHPFDNN